PRCSRSARPAGWAPRPRPGGGPAASSTTPGVTPSRWCGSPTTSSDPWATGSWAWSTPRPGPARHRGGGHDHDRGGPRQPQRRRPGGPAELSRRLLDLPWGAEDDTSVGWAGLTARGLASPQGRPTGFASAIGLVLTAPGRWTALRVDQTSGRRALLVLEGALGTLLVVPRPPGVLDLVPLPGDPAGPASVVPT